MRGLVGGGSATLGASDLGGLGFGRRGGNIGRFPANFGRVALEGLGRLIEGRFDLDALDFLDDDFTTSTTFFIAEPEVNVILNISERIRFSVGVSYRFIGGAGRLNNRLGGFATNVALKMSFF